jgi:hypothetical protein
VANPVVRLPVLESGFGKTLRKDAWWAGPALTVAILSGFIVYATFRAFENNFFEWGSYLSPFYSPYIPTKGLPLPLITPALLILPGPATFRLTCYYYRKAYYRSFAMDPPGCAVGERGAGIAANSHKYNGETKLLLFQNLHRFALYVAIAFLVFLWHDFVKSLFWTDGFHLGVGSLVILTNCTLLSLYTFSCHSFRHLVGGGLNSYSGTFGALRHQAWKVVSMANEKHMQFAWVSLFGVALTDLYVRSVASGAIADIRIF